MNSKKETLLSVLLWGLVVYALALLIYCTFKNFIGASADSISAFGSILGACASIFAAFVAAYLFNDWREIHNQTTYKDICTSIFNTQTKLNVKLISINDNFSKAKNNYFIPPNSYNTLKIADLIEKDVQQVGDLMSELLYQIVYLKKLIKSFNNPSVDKMNDLLLDYITLMDITRYKDINDHMLFLKMEADLKKRWDDIEGVFLDLLAKQTISKI
ncbi:hypothetical protein RMB12_14420 [Acinetobacter sp. V117_2]|uniref:hypothetical protein n=1 Tax=Acinetobacter sp. V117_2 TaxID=3072989 RepID=UPI00287F38CB|nr:hypothetical protein [Acinetobacter sp. V117_2]MDS7968215.1 hypothetical protein [Acinetobacter sp. V117_2]